MTSNRPAGRTARTGLRWAMAAALALWLVPGMTRVSWAAPQRAPAGARTASARSRKAAEAPRPVPAPRPPTPGIYNLADLTSVDVARVDRDQSVLLQPLGLLQTHGPHLPIGTDDIIVDALVRRTAEKLRRDKPELTVLILPTLPVGAGPFPEMGGITVHSSTLALGSTRLRDFLAAWLLSPAENRWLNCCVVSWHRDPEHLRRVSEVCDYYTETLGMRAVNVTSLVFGDSTMLAGFDAVARRHLGDTPEADLRFDLHGGAAETSILLDLEPGLVRPDYRELDDQLASSYDGLVALAQRLGWPGYIGAPARATPEYGRELLDAVAAAHEQIILSVLAGESWLARPRFEAILKSTYKLREAVRYAGEFEKARRDNFEGWLKGRKAP